ncbi:MAG TPA: hypothetical protein VGM03_13395 [Phycisphaerae bacterium]|jgi:hypothetical protein
MTAEQVRRELSQIKIGDIRALSALAQRISAEVRQPAAVLMDLWKSAGPEEQRKSEAVLGQLAEPAVEAWLVTASAGGERGARALAQAVQTSAAAQRRILHALQGMLDSKLPMPRSPSAGQTEERELSSRECDEAYLLTRWLMKTDEPALERALARKRFLSLVPAQRDSAIAAYRKNGQWMALADTRPAGGER